MTKPKCYKSSYAEKLKDPRWQRKRLEVMNRDAFTCRDCESKDKTLNVHHCFYEKGDPWDTADQFLITVCEGCHKERHESEDLAKREMALLFTKIHPAAIHSIACDAHWMLGSSNLHEGVSLVSAIHYEFEAKVRWKNLLDAHKIAESEYVETLKKSGQFL